MNPIVIDGYPTKAFDFITNRRLTPIEQQRESKITLTLNRDLIFLFEVIDADHTVSYEDPLAFNRKVTLTYRVHTLTDDKDNQRFKLEGTIFEVEYHPPAYEQPVEELHELPDEENEFQLVPPGPTRSYRVRR
jgi:hypothetical protein